MIIHLEKIPMFSRSLNISKLRSDLQYDYLYYYQSITWSATFQVKNPLTGTELNIRRVQ